MKRYVAHVQALKTTRELREISDTVCLLINKLLRIRSEFVLNDDNWRL